MQNGLGKGVRLAACKDTSQSSSVAAPFLLAQESHRVK